MFDLLDKVVLVTGGASGIGLQAVNLLLNDKVKHVAFLDISDENGLKVQEELRKKRGEKRVRFIKCDVSNDGQLKAAFKSTVDEFGYIDVVFNNAGIARESMEEYKKEVDINLTAVITSTLEAINLMHKGRGGHGGVVVNVSSVAALMSFSHMPIYSATKSGVLQFSLTIGDESHHAKSGVRVITVCFGATDTTIVNNATFINEDIDKDFQEMLKNQTMQSPTSAAKALIDACKFGDTASVWVSSVDRPAQDITPVYKQAMALLEPYLNFVM